MSRFERVRHEDRQDPLDKDQQVRSDWLAAAAHDAYGAVGASDKSTIKNDASTPKNGWTIGIDLAWRYRDRQNTLEQIDSLKQKTLDKPVTFIVQSYDRPASENSPPTMHRLLISNGKSIELPDAQSRGAAQDLRDLTAMTASRAKGRYSGIVLNADGNAGEGVTSVAGAVALNDLRDALKDGAAQSGLPKLDFVDLDCCLMGNMNVTEKLAPVADQLVASMFEELTYRKEGKKISSPQGVPSHLDTLLSNSSINPSQLADNWVQDTKGQKWGATSLAHFDLNKQREFESALSTFGRALVQSIGDKNNLAELQKLAQQPDSVGENLRDLRSFVGRVKSAIDSGLLSDSDREITKAADALLSEQDKFEPTRWANGMSVDLGALSVFLPSTTGRGESIELDPLSWLKGCEQRYKGMTQNSPNSQNVPKGHGQPMSSSDQEQQSERDLKSDVQEGVNALKRILPQELSTDLKALAAAEISLQSSANQQEFAQNLARMVAATEEFAKSPAAMFLARRTNEFLQKKFALEDLSSAPGWNSFIKELEGGLLP